jgi:hypothetical protein
MPITPLLLLFLGPWLQRRSRRAWIVVGALCCLGLLVQIPHFAVNYSYVHHYEDYENFVPAYGFLFLPESAPIVAQTRALFAMDYRVDMWLVNAYRYFGFRGLLPPLLGLFIMLLVCAGRLVEALRRCEASPQPAIE